MQMITSRRWRLGATAAGMMAAFTSRSEAVGPTDVEVQATPYGGTLSGQPESRGGCAFAPTLGANYGGLGARVRVRQREQANDPTRGLAVTAQAAVEVRRHELLREGSDHQQGLPNDGAMVAGALAVGYDWRHFGMHAGASVREVYGPPSVPCEAGVTSTDCLARATYPTHAVAVFPEVNLRAGRSDGFHGELGLGAYTPAMLLRPGVHLGVGYTAPTGADVMARCGLQSVTTSTNNPRCDLSGSVPVSDRVSLGLGGAVVPAETRVDFDGRATVTVRFGP